MTFLPIVERELRVRARQRATYRNRIIATAGMLVVWFVVLLLDRSSTTADLAKELFVTLGILSLAFSMVAGVFLTADCLSSEKREGTLGLLFLTDLRGFDVVLGKFTASSIHAVYGLLAVFPILALPILMGGVTIGEFWAGGAGPGSYDFPLAQFGHVCLRRCPRISRSHRRNPLGHAGPGGNFAGRVVSLARIGPSLRARFSALAQSGQRLSDRFGIVLPQQLGAA